MADRSAYFPLYAALLAVALLFASVLLSPRAHADHNVQPARAAGPTRIDTAALIATLDYRAGAHTALLARADDFPDALSAAALARALNAPILLTFSDSVPGGTRSALQDLGVARVVLLGGEAAISSAVENDLRRNYEVSRVAGPQRFATAAQIARTVVQFTDIALIDGLRTAFVVNGLRFPDALAAGAPASRGPEPIPILLVQENDVPSDTVDVLADLAIEQAVIVGGHAAVSQAVEDELAARGLAVRRVAGVTREQTAVRLADFSISEVGYDWEEIILVRGDAFPDALAAGPHAGIHSGPILLSSSPRALGEPPRRWLAAACPNVRAIQAIGGRGAVSIPVHEAAEIAAESCHPSATGQTYLVSPRDPVVVESGVPIDFSVQARFDEEQFTGPVDITLFPCESVSEDERPITFNDANGDDHADNHGTTTANSAVIRSVNGAAVNTRHFKNATPDAEGVITFTVVADAPDCAIATVFLDDDGDQFLDLAAQGNAPLEPFGIAEGHWQ